METDPVLSEERTPELRRTTLVPLSFSALAMIISWVSFVLSFYPSLCQSIYNWTGRDLETTRYVFVFTGILFTFCFVASWRAWRKTRI